MRVCDERGVMHNMWQARLGGVTRVRVVNGAWCWWIVLKASIFQVCGRFTQILRLPGNNLRVPGIIRRSYGKI